MLARCHDELGQSTRLGVIISIIGGSISVLCMLSLI